MAETVVAIVVTYNRKELLQQCLHALNSQTRPLDSIIVVDNASNDGTVSFLSKQPIEGALRIQHLRLEQNLGGAGGFHAGISHASAENFGWLWLMDDDAEPTCDALEKLLASPDTNQLGIGVCRVSNADGTLQERVLTSVFDNDRLFRGVTHSDTRDLTTVFSYPLLGVLVSKKCVQRVGNVRCDFFIQADDLEWTLRLSDPNGIAYVRDAVLVHHDQVAFRECRRMGRPVRYLTRKDLWKDYYGLRNWVLTARGIGLRGWRLYATKRYLQAMWQRLMVLEDFPLAAWLYSKAFFDGLTGRSGKRIKPGHGTR